MSSKSNSRFIPCALGIIATCALVSPAGAGAAPEIRTVALTGQPAPGTDDGVVFWLFTTPLNHDIMHPVIDEQGQLGFTGRVTGPGVNETNRNGLWAERKGELALIVRSGTHAPGTPAGVNFNGFASDYIPFPPTASGGRLAFVAELIGPGVSFVNGSGVWKETDAGIALVARLGDPAPGFGPGATFGTDTFLVDFNPVNHVLLHGSGVGAGITTANNEALFSDRSGTVALVLREGAPAPGLPGLVFAQGQLGASQSAFPMSLFNAQDYVFIQANLGGPGVSAFNDESLWIETNGQMSMLLREGQSAPGAWQGGTFGGESVTLGIYTPAFNDLGHVAFLVDIDNAPVSASVLYSTHTGVLAPVALPFDPAPGMDYDFGLLVSPVLSNAGKIAFRAAAPDDDTDPFTPPPFAVWSDRNGSIEPVVHPGDLIPLRGSSSVDSVQFLIGMNELGDVAFRSSITDPAQSYADGLFMSAADGTLHLIVATGELFDVFGDGSEFRTVERIVHGGLSENRQVAFRLDFTDQSSGHYVASLGGDAPLCPADLTGNGSVDVDDLLMVINAWGAFGGPADVTADGYTDINDLLAIINAWGACP